MAMVHTKEVMAPPMITKSIPKKFCHLRPISKVHKSIIDDVYHMMSISIECNAQCAHTHHMHVKCGGLHIPEHWASQRLIHSLHLQVYFCKL